MTEATDKATAVSAQKPNYIRGALFAIAGPLAGCIVWVALWEMDFIASSSAYLSAWLTVYMYKKGAGKTDRKGAYIILSLIVSGIVLAFYASYTADSMNYLFDHYSDARAEGVFGLLTDSNFWSFNNDNMISSDVLKYYSKDILFSVAFIVWGAYSTIKEAFMPEDPQEQPATDKNVMSKDKVVAKSTEQS